MPVFTARELETETLLEHVRRQRSVLVRGRGGVGKPVTSVFLIAGFNFALQ